jgi:hypothetical protein
MKKRIIITTMFFLLLAIPVWCQTTNDDLATALASIGLSKTWATVIVLFLATIVGKIWPKKWTDPLNLIIKFAKVFIVALDWLNDKVNNGSKEEKIYREKAAETDFDNNMSLKSTIFQAWKYPFILLLFVGFSSIASAQLPEKWDLLKPVQKYVQKTDKISDTIAVTANDNWIMRLNGGLTTTKITIDNKELKSDVFAGVGAGLSYSHYKKTVYQNINDFSIDLMFAVSTTDENKGAFSTILGGTYYNIFSLGVGYDWTNKQIGVFPKLTWVFD